MHAGGGSRIIRVDNVGIGRCNPFSFFSVSIPHIFSSYAKHCLKMFGFSYGNRRSNRPSCRLVPCDFYTLRLYLAEIVVFSRSIFSSIFSPLHEVILDAEDARNQGVHCVSFVCVDGATLRRTGGEAMLSSCVEM